MQKTFSRTVVVDASYEEVQVYYSAPTILYRETPPWQPFGGSRRRAPMICDHLLKKLMDAYPSPLDQKAAWGDGRSSVSQQRSSRTQ